MEGLEWADGSLLLSWPVNKGVLLVEAPPVDDAVLYLE
jgi:hypothetical protein